MTTYADPTRCPDCSAPLPGSPARCPSCALPLTGPNAVELFEALTTADRALGRLRSARVGSVNARQSAAVAMPTGATTADPSSTGGLLDGVVAYPTADRQPVRTRSRLTSASVPKILLSLGALCLLVAAVTFLAVAWSWLGVGGRTTVLAGLTVVTLVLAVVMQRRGLRMTAEAFSVVGLGLLSLDVVGAHHAGWLGTMGDGGLTLLAGGLVSSVALGWLAVGPARPLVAPSVIAPLAALVATFGATAVFDDSLVPMALSAGLLIALAALGRRGGLGVLTVSALAAAGLEWLMLVAVGIDRALDDETVGHLWGHLGIWPLVAGTALLAVVAPALRLGRRTTSAAVGAAALLASLVGVFAVLDNGLTDAAGTLAVVAAAWTAVVVTGPKRWRVWAAVPLVGTMIVPVGCGLVLLTSAVAAVAGTGQPFTRSFDVHVLDVSLAAAAWLLLPALVLTGAAGCALAMVWTTVRRSLCVGVLIAGAVLGVIGTLPLYDVPLALVVGVLVAVALGLVGAAGRTDIAPAATLLAAGGLVLAAASLAALPSDALTALVLALVTALAAVLLRREGSIGHVASSVVPVALGGLDWAVGSWAGVPEVDRAAPLLLALGVLAIWRPRAALEVPAILVATLASLASVAAANDIPVALALYLTLAGALLTTTSLVHPSRRAVAWPGGLLLAAATWVRLWDVGVTTPEAYTLPTALVLVAVGMGRLNREPGSSTITSLAAGLSLATVPSLFLALGDPESLRALLLGAACLVLVLLGARLRWNAPLFVGAAVGALLVLRELAPYAAQVPPWLLIGLSGTLLTIVGVTWESRMKDLRQAGRYVGRLR